MLTDSMIQDVAARAVAAATDPQRVILFGSYARGNVHEYSDLDILVIEGGTPHKGDECVNIHRAIGPIGVGGVDVIVMSQYEFERRSQVKGTLPWRAQREGRLLYDATA